MRMPAIPRPWTVRASAALICRWCRVAAEEPVMLTLSSEPVSLATLRRVLRAGVQVELGPQALAKIAASRAVVARIVNQDGAVYGVNTGFGLLAQTRIPRERLGELPRNPGG